MKKNLTFVLSFGSMICDASSFPISDSFTYNEIRKRNCNVIVVMNDNYNGGHRKPKYVYPGLSAEADKWVSFT